MTRRFTRRGAGWRGLGITLAILALLVRFATGAAVLDPAVVSDLAALTDAQIDCGPALPEAPTAPAPHDRGRGLAALADALADAGAQPAPTLLPAIVVPEGRGALLHAAAPAATFRGPPPVPPGHALPRGPPALA